MFVGPGIWRKSRPGISAPLPVPLRRSRESRLSRGEPRARHTEGRRRHVGQTGAMEEIDRRRVAAVLAADADLEVGLRLAAALDAHAHHGADAFLVDAH